MAAKKNPYGGVLYNPEAQMSGRDLHEAAKKFAEAKYRSAIDQSRRDTRQGQADQREGLRRLQGYYDSYKPDMAKGVDSDSYQIAKSLLAQKDQSVPSNASSEGGSYADKVKSILGNYADRHLIATQQNAEGRNTAILQRAKEDYGQANNRYTRRIDDSKMRTSDLLGQYGGEYNTRLLGLRQSEAANAAARRKAESDYQLGQQRMQMEQDIANQNFALRQAGLNETRRHNIKSESKSNGWNASERKQISDAGLLAHNLATTNKKTRASVIAALSNGVQTGFTYQNGQRVPNTVRFSPYIVDEAIRRYERGGGRYADSKPRGKKR